MKTGPMILAAILVATAAQADNFVETFDNGGNTGGWSFFAPQQTIESTGGNPGWFLHGWMLDTFAPQPQTIEASIFTGNYRAMDVTSIGVDVEVIDVDFTAEGRQLALMLYQDNGTPGDFSDDYAAYTLGPEIPNEGEGWRSFDFDVPSQATGLPADWAFIEFGPDANPDWNTVISDVTTLGFFFGDPTFFYIFQMWDVGLDNPRITYGAPTATQETTWGGIKALYR